MPARKYPWYRWQDGQWHKVRKSDVPRTFREMLHNQARRDDLKVGIRKDADHFIFRFGRGVEEGHFIARDGKKLELVGDLPEEAEEKTW